MGKNVAVFVDVANIFYAAKAAGVDIDYVTLLKSATAGRDFVRAYAYTGLDPENENQRNFHQFLARHSYKVVSKDIRKYGDGKVKANLDIELVVDLMKTARNLDIAVVVSGDGDFASAIRAVQEMGVRCEVISFRGNTSSDLIEVADLFTDITQIAKVDKGSTRSGRRVADDEEDLSMTEVPEKQSEGTGRGRGRGRGRARSDREETPAATSGRGVASRGTAARRGAAAGLVALPGEKLSHAAATAGPTEETEPEAVEAIAESDEPVPTGETAPVAVDDGETADGDARRRRRRRGGRGRGRGHRDEISQDAGDVEAGDVEAGEGEVAEAAPAPETGRSGRSRSGELPTPFDDLEAFEAPRAPRSTPFGSVWDRQLGTPPARRTAAELSPPPEDDEDLEEPEIPEYLIAERRQGQQRGGRGGGARGAYAAAIERERYGGGRGASVSRYAEPTRHGSSPRGGGQGSRGQRPERPERPERAPRSGSGGEPWSEVPPELEQLLRAQLAQGQPASAPASIGEPVAAEAPTVADAAEPEAPKRRPTRRTTTRAKASTEPAEAPTVADAAEPEAPKRRPTRRTTTRAKASTEPAEAPTVADAAEPEAPKRRPTRRTTTRAKASTEPAEAPTVADAAEPEAPKRRPTRRTTTRAKASTEPAEG